MRISDWSSDVCSSDLSVDRLLTVALRLEGLYRHASTHAAGVVIGDRPLDELVPLYRDPRSDMPVTQFNMKFVEQAGLVKRSEEHTSELQSLMRISYAVFCLKKKRKLSNTKTRTVQR